MAAATPLRELVLEELQRSIEEARERLRESHPETANDLGTLALLDKALESAAVPIAALLSRWALDFDEDHTKSDEEAAEQPVDPEEYQSRTMDLPLTQITRLLYSLYAQGYIQGWTERTKVIHEEVTAIIKRFSSEA